MVAPVVRPADFAVRRWISFEELQPKAKVGSNDAMAAQSVGEPVESDVVKEGQHPVGSVI